MIRHLAHLIRENRGILVMASCVVAIAWVIFDAFTKPMDYRGR